MVHIEVNNSYSKINNLTPELLTEVKKELSYTVSNYFSPTSFVTKRYLIDKYGTFPTGLLDRVVKTLGPLSKITISDRRTVPVTFVDHKPEFSGVTPYFHQAEAMVKARDMKRIIISMPTGSGKSLVIALIAACLSVRTLVVVPTLQIKEQFIATLNELFGDTSNIRVENIDSSALARLTEFDCLIIDEAHHVAAKTYHRLNKSAWKGIYYRVFMTATPFRNNTEETMLFEGIAGSKKYEVNYQDAVKAGYICPAEAFYINLSKDKSDADTWGEVYKKYIVNNETRNYILANILLAHEASGLATLCLVKEIAHGNKLSTLTGIPFANGQDEESKKFITAFQKGHITTLIGTTGVVGEGVDTKPAEFVIIAGLGKAKSAFMQQIGRVLRKYKEKKTGKVIIFRDPSHRFLLRHFNEQVKILKEEYKIAPSKLEYR